MRPKPRIIGLWIRCARDCGDRQAAVTTNAGTAVRRALCAMTNSMT